MKFSTKGIHAGEKPDAQTGAVAPILVRTKTYHWPSFDSDPVYKYSRGKNPTRSILEEKLAGLEDTGGKQCYATVFASGVAAEACLFLTMKPGDHILFSQEIYGGTYRLIETVLAPFGLTADYVDFDDEEKVKSLIQPTTKYLFVETPTNPSLHIVDLEQVGKLSKKYGIPLVVDATFAPPVTTNSFAYGSEIVIYSLSKYFAGHNDAIGGAIVTTDKALDDKLRFSQGAIGAILSPDECYRIIQGIKTLDLRYRRASESAQIVAEYLARHGAIEKVFYPGLLIHKGYEIAKKQMTAGFGSVVSFVLKDESHETARHFVDTLIEGGLITYGESLASPETILAYPPLMSHKSLGEEVRQELGITKGFFRLSLGLEDAEDIISQLENALR